MKTLSITCNLLITAGLLFSGCKKENTEETAKSDCSILTLTEASVTASYVYDVNKKIASVAYSDGDIEDYTYRDDTTRILRTSSGVFESRKIITSNAEGLATQVRIEDNPAGTSGLNISFQYNGTELIQAIQKSIGSATTNVTIYSWSAGNLIEIRSGSVVTVFDYFTDKESQPGNYLEAVNLTQGYTIFKPKNLVKTISSSGSAANINYTFDTDGNISSTVFSGAINSAINFTYQCR